MSPLPTFLLSLLLAATAVAHHSPDELIAELTVKIEAAGDRDPLLYFQRATEYRALRLYAEAAADFRMAADLMPDDVSPRRALAQVLLWQGDLEAARAAVGDALSGAGTDERPFCHILLAEIERADGEYEAALAACAKAFDVRPVGEIDWFLLRAELQGELKHTDEQIADLDAGYRATSSVVLRNEWIEALIEGGEFETALPVIESELAACRLKSSWLIRRARTLTGLGKTDAARNDLAAALEELDRRVHPLRPHPGLLSDRAFVHASLGQTDLARADFFAARALDPDSWQLRKLARQFPALDKSTSGG